VKDILGILGEFLLIGVVVALIVAITLIPFIRADFKNQIVRYDAFKQSLKNARLEDMNELEGATILNKITEWNMDIESAKYWNKTIFGIYIPDEVTELELIK